MTPQLGRFFKVDPRWSVNMRGKRDLHVQEHALAEELAAIKPREVAA